MIDTAKVNFKCLLQRARTAIRLLPSFLNDKYLFSFGRASKIFKIYNLHQSPFQIIFFREFRITTQTKGDGWLLRVSFSLSTFSYARVSSDARAIQYSIIIGIMKKH